MKNKQFFTTEVKIISSMEEKTGLTDTPNSLGVESRCAVWVISS